MKKFFKWLLVLIGAVGVLLGLLMIVDGDWGTAATFGVLGGSLGWWGWNLEKPRKEADDDDGGDVDGPADSEVAAGSDSGDSSGSDTGDTRD